MWYSQHAATAGSGTAVAVTFKSAICQAVRLQQKRLLGLTNSQKRKMTGDNTTSENGHQKQKVLRT